MMLLLFMTYVIWVFREAPACWKLFQNIVARYCSPPLPIECPITRDKLFTSAPAANPTVRDWSRAKGFKSIVGTEKQIRLDQGIFEFCFQANDDDNAAFQVSNQDWVVNLIFLALLFPVHELTRSIPIPDALDTFAISASIVRRSNDKPQQQRRRHPQRHVFNVDPLLSPPPTHPHPFPFCRVGNYSCLKVDLMFTRDRSFYFTTVFIPGIILVTSSFITFWLEWNAVPARVMIGMY